MTVQDLAEELRISRTAYVRSVKATLDVADSSEDEVKPAKKSLKDKEFKVKDKDSKGKAKDRDHRTNQATTYTTPIVSEISRNLFAVQMDAAKASADSSKDRCKKVVEAKAHKTAIDDFVFREPIGPITLGSDVEKNGFYSKATIEGVEYQVIAHFITQTPPVLT